MKKLFGLIATLVLLLPTQMASAKESWTPDWQRDGYAQLVFEEGTSNNTASMVEQYPNFCDFVDDEKCHGNNWRANIILPACETPESNFCISSLEVGTDDKLNQGKFSYKVPGKEILGSTKYGIPSGSSPSIWKVPGATHTGGNDDYAIVVSLSYFVWKKVPNYQTNQVSFNGISAAIYPIKKTTPQDCDFRDPGCYVKHDWATGAKASLTLKVPTHVKGWLFGRLMNAQVEISPIDALSQQVKISANPMEVPMIAPELPCATAKAKIPAYWGKGCSGPGETFQYTSLAGGQQEADVFWDTFLPATKNKAVAMSSLWNYRSLSISSTVMPFGTELACLSKEKGFFGLVTTNAVSYDSNAPKMNKGYLNYKVRSVHFMPDGKTPIKGYYDLQMASSLARCLYGFKSTPIYASISVTSENGENQYATTQFTEKNNWVRLMARDFHYSKPTVRTKLRQKGSTGISVEKFKWICINAANKQVTVNSHTPKCPANYRLWGIG